MRDVIVGVTDCDDVTVKDVNKESLVPWTSSNLPFDKFEAKSQTYVLRKLLF